MNPQETSTITNKTGRYLATFCAIVGVVVICQLAHTLDTKNSTGVLVVNTNNTKATVTASEENYLQGTIGTGNVRTRLQPGAYTITASTGNETASAQVIIEKGQSKTISVIPKAPETSKTSGSSSSNSSSKSSGTSSTSSASPAPTPTTATQAMDNNLIQRLPFIGAAFSYEITYAFTGPNKSQLVVTVTAPTQNGQQLANTWLQGLGFNPSNLDIQYYYGAVAPS